MQVKSVPNPAAPGSTIQQTMQTGPGIKPDVRARAIEMIQNGGKPATPAPQAQEHPVQNPSQVEVEELSAIRSPASGDAPTTVEETATTQEETPQPEPKQDRDPALSRQFAQLARQEKILRQRHREFQQQQEAFKAEKASLEAKMKDYETGYLSRQDLKNNTLRALADAGVSYEELTQQILNSSPPNPQTDAVVSRLEAKISQLEQALKKNEETFTQRDQQQRQAAERQIAVDAADLVRSNPVAYEAINKIGPRGVKEVVKLITRTYDRDGVVMSVEQAADKVESYLIDENYAMASSISKIKRRLAEAGQPKPTQQTQAQPKQTGIKTLTNDVASTRKMTSRERAIAAMEGRLK